MAKRICAFGMDGFIVPMMRYFVREGALPNFARMIDEGTVNQTAPSIPVWTPTNWATLSTGAHTGTHGATRWSVDAEPGGRIDSFDGRAVNAERIWNALEHGGLKGAALHYPAAHPSRATTSCIVDGFGHPGLASTEYEVACCQLYTTEDLSSTPATAHDGSAATEEQSLAATVPELRKAVGWHHLPPSQSPCLETVIDIKSRTGAAVKRFHLLALNEHGNGYDSVRICSGKDGQTVIAQAQQGRWSAWVTHDFEMKHGNQRASLRFKLLDLGRDGKRLRLYRSQVTYADGFAHPAGLDAELVERFGPYQAGLVDFDTALEECEYQGMWFADVANFLMHERACSHFTCHWHLFDYINHIHLHQADPASPAYNPDQAEEKLGYFRRCYQVADRVLGRLWDAADAQTYVGVVADHGAAPDVRVANLRKFLHERGFLHLACDQETLEDDWVREEDIDWQKTTAYLTAEQGFDI